MVADENVVAHNNRWVYDAMGTNNHMFTTVGLRHRPRREMVGECIVGGKWIFRKKQRFAFRTFHLLVDNNHGRCTCQCFRIVFGVINKHNITVFNLVYFIDAGDGKIVGTVIGTFYNRGDFAECMWTGQFHGCQK